MFLPSSVQRDSPSRAGQTGRMDAYVSRLSALNGCGKAGAVREQMGGRSRPPWLEPRRVIRHHRAVANLSLQGGGWLCRCNRGHRRRHRNPHAERGHTPIDIKGTRDILGGACDGRNQELRTLLGRKARALEHERAISKRIYQR